MQYHCPHRRYRRSATTSLFFVSYVAVVLGLLGSQRPSLADTMHPSNLPQQGRWQDVLADPSNDGRLVALFHADVNSSTERVAQGGNEAVVDMFALLEKQRAVLAEHGLQFVKYTGDGLFAALVQQKGESPESFSTRLFEGVHKARQVMISDPRHSELRAPGIPMAVVAAQAKDFEVKDVNITCPATGIKEKHTELLGKPFYKVNKAVKSGYWLTCSADTILLNKGGSNAEAFNLGEGIGHEPVAGKRHGVLKIKNLGSFSVVTFGPKFSERTTPLAWARKHLSGVRMPKFSSVCPTFYRIARSFSSTAQPHMLRSQHHPHH